MVSEAASSTTSGSTFQEGVGQRIRERRKAMKWTLKDLSEQADLPLSTLSKIETGRMNVNIQKLARICRAMDMDIMQMVAPNDGQTGNEAQVTGRRSVTRHGEERRVQSENAVYLHHAGDFSRRRLTPAVMELDPGCDPGLISHQGEEFIYVLDGAVEVLTEFYEPTRLETGESIYLDSTMGHNVRAADGEPARILNVMTATSI
ncbi:MAG TPA: hypothetical protein DD459_00940 [Halieaceae bacterium]|nr:hypothetical protein [Halieaceae bacterium]|tara:strand:+ start:6952 stop:7563 length:612 start_codon:yes stop_codon:yes gene_type:complete